MFKRRNLVYIAALIFIALIVALFVAASNTKPVVADSPAQGNGQEVCPGANEGWTKFNTSNEPQSVPINADQGKLIVGVCYKAGNVVNKTDPLNPPVTSYEFNSTVWNKEGCDNEEPPNGCNYQAISHYSYKQQSIQYASATASVIACGDGDATTPVVVSVTHATMTINPGGIEVTGGDTLNLAVGDYTISYDIETVYHDPGNLPSGFRVLDCSKESADASASVGSCTASTVTEPVTLFVSGATMHVYEGPAGFTPFDHTGTHTYNDLPAGSYKIKYTFNEDAQDPGVLPTGFTIGVCEKKETSSFVLEDPWCEWTGTKSVYQAEWTLKGAKFSITGDGFSYGPVATSDGTTLDLGQYKWSWVNDEGFYDAKGGGSWDLSVGCEPSKESISMSSSCRYEDDQSWNYFNIQIGNATFYIDNQTIEKDTTLKFLPGDYPWSWESANTSDNGVFTAVTCEPKEEEDPSPDVAAGGLGPSASSIVATSLLAITGISVVGLMINKKFKIIN